MVFLTASLSAQELSALDLSLEQAVNSALENNLDLKKTGIDLAASGYSERNLWSEVFPSISASASIGNTSPLFSGDGFAVNERTETKSISASISLGLNAGIPFSMASVKLAHQTNLLRYEDAKNQLSIQVTKNYYALKADKNNLLLLDEIQNLAVRQYERNQISYRNGLIGELALTQARLSAENARYNYSAALISYNNSMAEFLAMLGMESGSAYNYNDVNLPDEIYITKISADAEELIDRHLSQRPDIVRARNEVERLNLAEKRTALQSRAPSLSLSLNWSSGSFDPFIDSLRGTATLSVPIDPWIPGTSRSQDIRRANDALEKAVLDLTMAENSAKNQIRTLTARLNNTYDSILIARLSYEASQRNYELTERGFNNGAVEYLALNDARNNMAAARQRLLQSELSYLNMILDLSGTLNIDYNYLIETYGVESE